MKLMLVVSTLFAVLMVEKAYAASDLEVARKFSPILILTEETGGQWGDIRVIKPEPVTIVGAESADSLRFDVYAQYPETNPPTETTVVGFAGWNPPLTFPNVKKIPPSSNPPYSAAGTTIYPPPTPQDIENAVADSNFLRIDFSQDKFSFLRPFEYIGYPTQTVKDSLYKVYPYFDYPGTGPEGWNDTYFGSGPKAGENPSNPNTAYVHIYETTHESYDDSLTVIQYFYFYPYNHWWNLHEGDWPRVDVVVSSRDTTANVIGVEYSFHGAHLSYYEDYVYEFYVPPGVGNSGGGFYTLKKADLTDSFVFNPQVNVKLSQGTHPVVYVGAGSHGSFPVGGRLRIYDAFGRFQERDEAMTHTGLVLSTQADDSHSNLWESYNLVVLPEPDPANTTNNMGLDSTMSWLGAEVKWGTRYVDSSFWRKGQ